MKPALAPLAALALGLALKIANPSTVAQSAPPQGYYRFPAIHGPHIVFTSEGDLWLTSTNGGTAQRLTSHPGVESHAAISPDGSTLAFSAEYEGPREIYTMPLTGGLPTRLTFDSEGGAVVGWTPDSRILYRTEQFSTLPNAQLVVLDPRSGARRVLPLAQASAGAYSPNDGTLIFTRLPWQGSSTKRYQGGSVENLWRLAPDAPEAEPITADFKGTSRNPLWWEGRVYFLSDRDGIMNLWSMRPDGSEARQHTRHRDFDAASASLDSGRVVYQHGANLRLYDIARDTDEPLTIRLASDFDQRREKWVKKPLEYLTAAHLSPDGNRVVLTARGQVFVAPTEQGRFVEVPRPSEVRYRDARFLPDGKSLVALSDQSGELEFWRLPADGVGQPFQLTTNSQVFRFEGVPSPDGQWLTWADKNHRLWIHHLETHETRQVAESRMRPLTEFSWSPDSQWLAYVDPATNDYPQLRLYRPSDNRRVVLTSDRVESYSAAWSPDGKWLYFLSDRQLRSLVASPWGPRQPEPFFVDSTKIYHLALTNGLRSPFAPLDELQSPAGGDPAAKSKDKEKETAGAKAEATGTNTNAVSSPGDTPAPVSIALDGLTRRLFEVPVPAGTYEHLEVTKKYLYWLSRDLSFEGKTHLKQLEITAKDPKPKTFAEDITSYELSADGKKLLLRKGDDFYVVASDTAAPAKLEDKVKLEGWTFALDPREEWQQVFTEAWRMMRDYFYDRGLHQVDWPAMLRKYRPLVDRVSDRGELSDAIAQMVGELSTLHIFVALGDFRHGPDSIKPSSLGAQLVRDDAAGGWRVEHVYRADPDYPDGLAPLSRPGVDVGEGDTILSINGRPTLAAPHPSALLRNQAGKQVLLEVKPKATEERRKVIVTPIKPGQEEDLRYDEWELTRREAVETLGQGRIGYVHLRAMGQDNIAEWARNFYPIFQRQGLIIDVRHNRGGNIDSWILGKLLRKAWFFWQPRVGDPTWNMHYAFRGHVVVLCNEHTASDGEAFTEGFRRLGLGKVIGTRTWGGEIWLSAQRWLVDGGMATAAEFGVYGPEGEWLIEGHGVDPDLVVDNLPRATFDGRDAQLEAAVKHLEELIARDPRPVPPAPRYPDKSLRR